MNRIEISIEISGAQVHVGDITGSSSNDGIFTYLSEYLQSPSARPISISLPLRRESFSESQTRNFFDGLLPEGFVRRTIAKDIQKDEKDYLNILSDLGQECLGAIQIGKNIESVMPEYIRMSPAEVKELANEGVTKSVNLIKKSHLSLTGASGKVGLYYNSSDHSWYLPKGTAPSTHIVKQSHVRLNDIVVNEQLSLLTAKKLGIDIPNSFIVFRDTKEEENVLFATKRYDRIINNKSRKISDLAAPFRLHQEDFAQALGINSIDKYEPNGEHYLKKMTDLLRNNSIYAMSDIVKLWDAIIYNFLIGNTDGHLKNFSLIYSSDLQSLRLAPVYDVVATTIYESSVRNMAFSINGKKALDDIEIDDFIKEAESIGLSKKLASNRLKYFLDNFESALQSSAVELMNDGYITAQQIQEKIKKNGGIAVIR